MDNGQRFRFNVEIPFIREGQGPLVVEMSGEESENAEVWLKGLGLAFHAKGSSYTSDLLKPVLPGTYTMEVRRKGWKKEVGKWVSPPTIVSIRLLPFFFFPSICPAKRFEPSELRGGCNITKILQNDGQSYVTKIS